MSEKQAKGGKLCCVFARQVSPVIRKVFKRSTNCHLLRKIGERGESRAANVSENKDNGSIDKVAIQIVLNLQIVRDSN